MRSLRYLILLLSLLCLSSGCLVPSQVSAVTNSSIGASATTGKGTVKMSWGAPTTGAPTSYTIQQSTDGVNFSQIQQVNGTTLSASATGLVVGKVYYFKIRAANSAGSSAFSPTLSATAK